MIIPFRYIVLVSGNGSCILVIDTQDTIDLGIYRRDSLDASVLFGRFNGGVSQGNQSAIGFRFRLASSDAASGCRMYRLVDVRIDDADRSHCSATAQKCCAQYSK